jgi:hypothetical protein
MKKVRYWAITSLFAPLGLVASACYQAPAEPDEEQGQQEYAAPEEDRGELTEAVEAPLVLPVCKPKGASCSSDAECCTSKCMSGACSGGSTYGGGGTGNPCATLEDGAYCGGNHIPGNPTVLYRCYQGYQSVITYCPFGCQWMPPGVPDHCY